MADVTSQFKDLPMAQLIGAPFQAACKAQLQLANAAWQFMETIAYDGDGDSKKTRLLEFDLQRPVQTPSGISTNNINVKAPFLGLVPIPSLLIDDMSVDFQMEVTAASESKDSTSAEASVDASYKSWWGLSVEVHGKVTTSRENTRSTNQTAKYQVHVGARQQPQTEGLSKLMDIMASCIEPLKIEGASSG